MSESTVKEIAGVPLMSTALVPVKLLPVRVTWVPTGPLEGVKETMVGGLRTVKLVAEEPEPLGVVTEIGPVVALLGTVACSWVAESTVKVAGVPLKATRVALVKLLPVRVTSAPTGPLEGLKEEISGAVPPPPTKLR